MEDLADVNHMCLYDHAACFQLYKSRVNGENQRTANTLACLE
jgi:hypothetical protein